jgi:aryl-alcohol dehydrogenase-like predicted oxidoreductase
MLTGAFRRGWKPDGPDFRAAMAPRFQGSAYESNLELVEEIERIAEGQGVLPAQIALAWVLGRAENIVVIPGTTRRTNLESNLGASGVQLSPDAIASLDTLASRVSGERYNEEGMRAVNG